MHRLTAAWRRLTSVIDPVGTWIGFLPVRLLMAYEFGKAGLMKYNGNNWFANVQENFPFPFNVIPVEISWFLATWTEILGAIGLVLGLFTRFWAFSLVFLSIVAIFGVHWPAEWSSLAELWEGYRVTAKDGSGNYRIPLLFIAMLVALMLRKPDRLSLDHLLFRRVGH